MKSDKKIKVIYNPIAGSKRKAVGGKKHTMDEIKDVMKKYQLEADYFDVTKGKRGIELAQESLKESYTTIVAAGGDGTVSEVARGLINSDKILGILPLGSYMNICAMLSIENDLDKAAMLIKLGRTRKIDIGSITRLNGEKLEDPHYFIEIAGIGLDAEIQILVREIEEGHFLSALKIIGTFINFLSVPVTFEYDGKKRTVNSTTIEITNGPISGANLEIAPDAKLNDHKLNVTLYKMSKIELISYIIRLKRGIKKREKNVERFKTQELKIYARSKRLVHADASFFGYTPVSFKIIPNALNVIYGFPEAGEKPSLEPRSKQDRK